MRTAVAAALILISLAACSDRAKKLAEPSGPVFRLNPDRWEEAERLAQPSVAAAR